MPASASALNEQFGIPDVLRFEDAAEAMPRAVITAQAATAVIYLHGAHVAEYQPADARPVLFVSRKTQLKPGKPIRGGVPICFPWFGPRQDDPAAPMHGLARTHAWDFNGAVVQDASVRVELTTRIDPFDLTYMVTVGPELRLNLRVHNTGAEPASFEQALHSYFAVSQVRHVEVVGLEGQGYLDKEQGFSRAQQGADPLRFAGETDRVFVNHGGACTLRDPGFGRRIVIETQNANSTIVWNPWVDKARRLPDLGDDEWPSFVCIESGNVADNTVRVEPGEAHDMSAAIRVEPLAAD